MVHLKLRKELCAGFFIEIMVYISTCSLLGPPLQGSPYRGPLMGPRAAEAEARLSGSGCRAPGLPASGLGRRLLPRLSEAGFRAWISAWISAGFGFWLDSA